ncbi:hypothetical protein vBPaeMUSP18_47 [Pseudomonas phage vB_PaeM_USP_18]|nr:hypothetical protein vBPaeMUSP18_47 [Pseudomonas phage vB_PaeM_USP_18]QLI49487.1 hypothetical protein vBPaeMUSP25_47 [Pseudomonas phage vB_PaeM_USP_25]
MHQREDDARLLRELIGTAESMGQAMSPNAAALIVSDLEGIPFPVVQKALRSIRATYKGRLTFQVIRERIVEADGRPEANEAWALALAAQDERESVVWTAEVMWAFDAARPILRAGDKVGARMAFISAYERLVAAAREEGAPTRWELSLGWDADRRAQALEQAVKLQRLPMDRALALGYDPAPQAITADGRAIAGLLSHDAPPQGEVSPELSKRLRALRQEIEDSARERERERQEQAERERREFQAKKERAAAMARERQAAEK